MLKEVHSSREAFYEGFSAVELSKQSLLMVTLKAGATLAVLALEAKYAVLYKTVTVLQVKKNTM